MKLLLIDFNGSVIRAVTYCNELALTPYVLAMSREGTVTFIVLRGSDYPAYKHVCAKLKRKPLDETGFFHSADQFACIPHRSHLTGSTQ